MDDNGIIVVQNADGSTMEVELITYLVSDDKKNTYIVYSKGEKNGNEGDTIIYISGVSFEGNQKKLVGITSNEEWANVQTLLKRIANS